MNKIDNFLVFYRFFMSRSRVLCGLSSVGPGKESGLPQNLGFQVPHRFSSQNQSTKENTSDSSLNITPTG